MGMTISEKIFAKKSGKKRVTAGDFMTAEIDLAVVLDVAGPHVAKAFQDLGAQRVWNKDKVRGFLDAVPASSVQAAENQKIFKDFCQRMGFEIAPYGEGIYHEILVDQGWVWPGELAVITDSHACTLGAYGAYYTGIGISDMALALTSGELWFKVPETIRYTLTGRMSHMTSAKDIALKIIGEGGLAKATYCTVEYSGQVIEEMSEDSKMSLCCMAVDFGAKGAIIIPDRQIIEKLPKLSLQPVEPLFNDPDAAFKELITMDISHLEPQVSLPPSIEQVKPVSEVEGIKINQIYLGTCTNGRLEDLEIAAKILKGKRVHPRVRMVVIPTTRTVTLKALEKGLIKTFLEAGAVVCNPNCGPCLGTHEGLLASGEVCLSTGNRNYQGRMGSPKAEIYLASPATAAASAITGEITDPRKIRLD